MLLVDPFNLGSILLLSEYCFHKLHFIFSYLNLYNVKWVIKTVNYCILYNVG